MTKLVGAHVSAAGGVHEAILRASEIGATAFALFLKNERRWSAKPMEESIVDKFKEYCETHKFDPLTDMLPHGSYLINLGTPDGANREKAEDCLLDDLQRCERLGIGHYNLHPGSSLGSEKKEAIERIAKSLNRVISQTNFVKIVLENMTGNEDRVVGTRLEDLAAIINKIENKSRIGVCIDTCHSFASGYDLRSTKQFEEFWKLFDATIGYQYLSSIHLNDSKYPLGAKRDMHQKIGYGFLGLETFRLVMNKPELMRVIKVLETPTFKSDKKEPRAEEIELLKWLVGKGPDDKELIQRSEQLQALGAKERAECLEKHEKAASTHQKQTKLTSYSKSKKRKLSLKKEELLSHTAK